MKILVTGGCGFFGHHFVEHVIKNTNWEIVIFDTLTYASNGFDRLRDINCFDHGRIKIMSCDFTQKISDGIIKEIGNIDHIIHLGAETHVDNSIRNPEIFVRTNVIGTMNMLELARKIQPSRFFYMGTDEVFGPAPIETVPNGYKEWDRYNSTNPYSASKAGGEELCLAWANCYGVPVQIGHTMNLFGERQHPEKFIPMTIKKILNKEKVLIHSDKSKTISGSRFWIHCRNAAEAILFILEKGTVRDKVNVVGEKEVSNLEIAQIIAEILGKPLDFEMVDFHSSRPGHDLRYGLCGDKLKAMGFEFKLNFQESIEKTIKWTIDNQNQKWLYSIAQDSSEVS